MGQGLIIKVAQVVAEELAIALDQVKITATDTGKVPNTSATAASSATDLNGAAAQAAAQTHQASPDRVCRGAFRGRPRSREVRPERQRHGRRARPCASPSWSLAYMHARISSPPPASTAHRRSTGTASAARGRPFFYFAYGAAVSEVAVDTLTGEYKLLRVDFLHDVGRSLNPAIDLGQIEGGFVQGVGWLTTEELCWNAGGPAHDPRALDLQDPDGQRLAGGFSSADLGAGPEPGAASTLQGGRRAAADARHLGVPRDRRCDRESRRRPREPGARRAGHARAGADGGRGDQATARRRSAWPPRRPSNGRRMSALQAKPRSGELLLGTEGLALLRLAFNGDDAARRARVSEVRSLLQDLDDAELAAPLAAPEYDVDAGYASGQRLTTRRCACSSSSSRRCMRCSTRCPPAPCSMPPAAPGATASSWHSVAIA